MLKTLSRNPSSGSSSDAASPTKKSSSGIGKLFGKKGVLTRVASGLKKSNSVKIETPTTSPLSGKEVRVVYMDTLAERERERVWGRARVEAVYHP